MSRYRQTMSDLLEQVRNPKQESADYLKSKMTDTQINNIKKTWQMKTAKDVTPAIKKMIKDLDIPTQLAIKHANIPHISKLVEASDDHEISMAQGELKAISAKANDLANMLSTKSDDTDELEAWVQSKITKAKDYISSVADYLTHNPGQQNEELVKENFSPSQIARLKKEYEVLRGKKISVANANKLSQMFKNIPDSGLKDIFKADIPFLSVMAMTKMIQKGIPRPAGVKLNLEEVEILDEATQDYLEITEGKIDSKKFDSLKKGDSMTITYNSTMSGTTVKKFIVKSKSRSAKYNTDKVTMYPDGNPNMARFFLYKRASGDVSMATGDMAASIVNVKEVSEGRMSEIDAMVKDGKTAAEIAKALKLNVRDVKAILGEEIEEEKEVKKGYHKMPDGTIMKDTEHKKEEEEPKEDDKEKLKAELEKKEAEIEMLKTKAETEKAKVAKKETEKLVNPETGEPLLQVGIAYKHLKDKMSKQQSEHFEQYMVEYTSQQIKMAYGVANDKRYKGGNYSGAVKAIEKIARGLSNHPDVQKVLKRTNEQLDEMAKDKAYAIGMAAAKKKYNDEPPLEKKTIKKGHEIADKLLKMKKPVVDEELKEFKKMTVTFKDMADMSKASTDLAKKGFTINAKGLQMKVDGKGADLNKYATDLQNFYKATVKAEGTMIGGIVTDNSGKKMSGYDKAKKALKDFMSKPQPAKGADNKVMAFIFDDELLDDLYSASKKNMSDVRPLVKKRLKSLGIKETLDEGKYTRYSDLLVQLGRMKQAKDKQGEMNTQKEIDKEKRKLGINEEHPSKQMFESLAALKKKADKSGMPYSILKKVFDRGMAAWKGGHRPGASQHQWAYARVNSFVTKSSGTWGGADKDLAAKVKGE